MLNRWLVGPRTMVASLTMAIAVALIPSAIAGDPVPGEVYREFTVTMFGSDWRVTDPNATNPGQPGNTPGDYLPNAMLPISLPSGSLAGAKRADLTIDMWGGHVGTINRRFRFNGKPWISIPELGVSTPPAAAPVGNSECYIQQWNPVVTVPLGHLVEGTNTLSGTSGGQTCYNFNWGQWGWYAATLRIYYDPTQVAHPTGIIVSPASGSTFGDNAEVRASIQSTRPINRVEFLARYEGPDVDGDGISTEYHQSYQRELFRSSLPVTRHVGTATGGATSVTWDTSLVPDQAPGSIQILARICDNSGVCFVTEPVNQLTLDRDTSSVRLYKASRVPQRHWVRAGRTLSSEVEIPDTVDLGQAVWAALLVRTWNGRDAAAEPGQTHYTRFNGWETPEFGGEHFYSYDVVEVPTSTLKNGVNTVTFNSMSAHHGIEILWPGPELIVHFSATQPGCGDGVVGIGEECDDGGESPLCNSDCTVAACGDGQLNVAAGEECDDGNSVDTDTCTNDCRIFAVATCGDGVIDAGEECDDAGESDTCDANCSFPVCGDRYVNTAAGEECDDGNSNPDDACGNDCTRPATPLAPAYYGFEGSDSTAFDTSGQNNHGSILGAQRDPNGRYGQAMRFDGTAGHVDLGGLDISGTGLTLMAWIRPDSFATSDARIISKTTSPFEQDHYWMLSTLGKNGIRLRFRVKTDTQGTTTHIASGATLSSGVWTHVAATYDGSMVRLYQDGILVGSAPLSGAISANPAVTASIGDNPDGSRTFDGLIDEVRIEPRALTAAEIQTLMDRPVDDPQACSIDADCDDGLVCNGDESCLNGSCIAGQAPNCDDGIACTDDSCDESLGGCAQLAVDSACDDGLYCNGDERCDVLLGCADGPAPCSGGECDDTADICVAASNPSLESGTVVVGPDPVHVLLRQSYLNPVIVSTVRYANNSLPVVVRIGRTDAQSFDLRLQGAGHTSVLADEVTYLVVEEGVWNLDGVPFEAHRYLSTVTDDKGSWVGERRAYAQPYLEPVVLGQVMSENDARWSVFWDRGALNSEPPSSTELWTGKTVGEDPDRARANEWIGYVVFEAGHGLLAGVEYETRVGADSVRGLGTGAPYLYPFAVPFPSGPPAAALVGLAGLDGTNGGWAQTHAVDAGTMYVSVDEDVALDGERLHTNEQLAYMALSAPLVYPDTCPAGLPYEEFFDIEPLTDPVDWYDTRSENSLRPVDGFRVYSVARQLAFGTRSRKNNLHSHYVGAGSSDWTDYRFNGRMLLADSEGGVGVTAFSDYPNSDRYYRLRRFNGERSFRLTSHGTSITCDVRNTGVDPTPKAWYEFVIELRDLGDRTEILAKTWAAGTAEPDWQQRCTDTSSTRLTHGTVGVWSMGYAGKYWDSFRVQCNPGR